MVMPVWTMLHPEMTMGHLGYLPPRLDLNDPSPAKEQLGRQQPGGWFPFHGPVLRDDNSLKCPGDPPLRPLAQTRLRDELIVFYDHSWVAIIQPDRSFEVARMD